MTDNFGEVVDRVYRDWLFGPDEQPITADLSGALTDSATSMVLTVTPLTPDEKALLSPGTLAEIGYEQVFITAWDENTSTATIVRGRNATDAASHGDGDPVTLLPQWGRQTVLDAVLDDVPRLYPSLTCEKTTTITSATTGYVEVPADVATITHAYYTSGGRYQNFTGLELLTDFGPSSTGKAVQFRHGPGGKTVYLAYRGSFTLPAAASDTLADTGVDESWVPILAAGAAAAVIASEDIDKATVEFATRQLEAQQFPVGSSARLRDALLGYRNYLLDQARRQQRAQSGTPVIYRQAVWVGP